MSNPPNAPDDPVYRAFIVRIWLEPGGRNSEPDWRFQIQAASTGEPHGFDSLETFEEFLIEEMEEMKQ